MTVGEIVADNFNNAGIFDKYGIDFCCHGSALLPEASKILISRVGLWTYWWTIFSKSTTVISVHKVPRLKNCWIKYVAYTVKNIRHSTMCRLSFMIPSPTSMPISTKRNWYCFPTSMRW